MRSAGSAWSRRPHGPGTHEAMARIDAIVLATNVEKVDYVETLQLLRADFATAMVPVVFLSGAEELVKFSYLKENQKYIDEAPAGATALVALTIFAVAMPETAAPPPPAANDAQKP